METREAKATPAGKKGREKDERPSRWKYSLVGALSPIGVLLLDPFWMFEDYVETLIEKQKNSDKKWFLGIYGALTLIGAVVGYMCGKKEESAWDEKHKRASSLAHAHQPHNAIISRTGHAEATHTVTDSAAAGRVQEPPVQQVMSR